MFFHEPSYPEIVSRIRRLLHSEEVFDACATELASIKGASLKQVGINKKGRPVMSRPDFFYCSVGAAVGFKSASGLAGDTTGMTS